MVKVEPPEGAPGRRIGPFADDVPDPERSLHFWYYNRGKRSVVLDVSDRCTSRLELRLLADADVVITSAAPARAAALGIEPRRRCRRRHPSLVVVSVTPFGLDGPWRDYVTSDLVSLAAGGPLMSCGYDDHSLPPIRPGGDQAAQTAAAFGHIGLLLALLERQRTGRGQVVDVSIHESLGGHRRAGQPVLVLPAGARATADVSPRPAGAHPAGAVPDASTGATSTSP